MCNSIDDSGCVVSCFFSSAPEISISHVFSFLLLSSPQNMASLPVFSVILLSTNRSLQAFTGVLD